MPHSEPTIPWPQVVSFVGQLNHDIRNYLNAIELQSAFVGEIVEGAEAKDEIRRLREMTAELGAQLQRLSSQLNTINVMTMPYQAGEFVEDLRAKINSDYPDEAAAIEWKSSLGEEAIAIDPTLLQEAFLELFDNAFRHERGEGALSFEARPSGEKIEFILHEPKTKFAGTMEDWGARPLGQLRHGHYGLGLFRARGIFEAHHGTLQAKFDPAAAALITTVALPRAH